MSAVFSPDGATVLTAAQDGTVRLWNAATGAEIRKWTCSGEWLCYAVFNADGTRVLAKWEREDMLTLQSEHLRPNYAALWDAASGREIRRVDLGDDDEAGPAIFSRTARGSSRHPSRRGRSSGMRRPARCSAAMSNSNRST